MRHLKQPPARGPDVEELAATSLEIHRVPCGHGSISSPGYSADLAVELTDGSSCGAPFGGNGGLGPGGSSVEEIFLHHAIDSFGASAAPSASRQDRHAMAQFSLAHRCKIYCRAIPCSQPCLDLPCWGGPQKFGHDVRVETDHPRPRPNWGVSRMGSRAGRSRSPPQDCAGRRFLPSRGVIWPGLLPPSSDRARQP